MPPAAATKARHGSLRAAADILIRGPRVLACAETDAKIHELYRKGPLEIAQQHVRWYGARPIPEAGVWPWTYGFSMHS